MSDLFLDGPSESLGSEYTAPSAPASNPVLINPVEAHDALITKLTSGTLALEEYHTVFAALIAQRETVLQMLGKMTKPVLLKRLEVMMAFRLKNDRKPGIAKFIYADMLKRYALDRKYGDDFCYAGVSEMNDRRTRREQALVKLVEETTQKELTTYAESLRQKSQAELVEQQEKTRVLTNPQSLEDFRQFVCKKGERELTIEQLERYDALAAKECLTGFLAGLERKRAERTKLRVVDVRVGARIIETAHTKKGHALWAVQFDEWLETTVFIELCRLSRQLSGNYSRYDRDGAEPGFLFRQAEHAQAFMTAVTQGDYGAASAIARQRFDEYADNLEQSTVQRLRTMSDRLEERSTALRDQDRKTNTAKRANDANRIEARARGDIALARTMRAVAGAIEMGEAQYLGDLRTKVQVELLDDLLATAHRDRATHQAKAASALSTDWERTRQEALEETPSEAAATFVQYPRYVLHRSTLGRIGRQLEGVRGAKHFSQSLLELGNDVSSAFRKFAQEHLPRIAAFRPGEPGQPLQFRSSTAAEASRCRSPLRDSLVVVTLGHGKHYIVLSPEQCKLRGLWAGEEDRMVTVQSQSFESMMDLVKRYNVRRRKLHQRIELPYHLEHIRMNRARLAAMGLETPAQLRAAIREYVKFRLAPQKQDLVQALMRNLAGQKNIGVDFFPTPRPLARVVVARARITENMDVCEPSAGYGALADEVRECGAEPKVCELSGTLREILEAKGYEIVATDFMAYEGYHDCFVMNPPFSQDAEHVQHAYEHLNPGGCIVAIVSPALFNGNTARAVAFQRWFGRVGGIMEKLPPGSFLDPSLVVTTGAQACLIVIRKLKVTQDGALARVLLEAERQAQQDMQNGVDPDAEFVDTEEDEEEEDAESVEMEVLLQDMS